MENRTNNSRLIFNSAQNTISSFFEIYATLDKSKEEQQQDLLRAIILFSCSAIDAIIKQLINDTLEEMIKKDEGAFNKFKNFVEKKIKNGSVDNNSKLLSEIFISDNNPKEILINILKKELTANSLQSADELFKVASFFNIETTNIEKMREIFNERNLIAHEMDINIGAGQLQKKKRTKKQVEEYSKNIFALAEQYINSIEKRINN